MAPYIARCDRRPLWPKVGMRLRHCVSAEWYSGAVSTLSRADYFSRADSARPGSVHPMPASGRLRPPRPYPPARLGSAAAPSDALIVGVCLPQRFTPGTSAPSAGRRSTAAGGGAARRTRQQNGRRRTTGPPLALSRRAGNVATALQTPQTPTRPDRDRGSGGMVQTAGMFQSAMVVEVCVPISAQLYFVSAELKFVKTQSNLVTTKRTYD